MSSAARVAAVAAVCAVARGSPPDNIQVANSTEILAECLRRQLMKDNYDYMSKEREPQPQPHAARGAGPRPPDAHSTHTNQFEVKKKTERGAGDPYKRLAERRKKVLRHMYDINKDMGKRHRSRYRYKFSDENDDVTDYNVQQTTTVGYKLLKLRNQYRRSGQAVAFMREESPQGVAIVKLGSGPFPEFRLGRARRQYMGGPRPLRDDDPHLPPLAGDLAHLTDLTHLNRPPDNVTSK